MVVTLVVMPIPLFQDTMLVRMRFMHASMLPHITMRHGDDAIVSGAFHEEAAVVIPIAVAHVTFAKQNLRALMRNQEESKIVIPKMIVGDETERFQSQSEIHVHRQPIVIIQAQPRPEHSHRRQRRPA